jgi:hypothetical protein
MADREAEAKARLQAMWAKWGRPTLLNHKKASVSDMMAEVMRLAAERGYKLYMVSEEANGPIPAGFRWRMDSIVDEGKFCLLTSGDGERAVYDIRSFMRDSRWVY